jgi:competence protein ComEC
MLLPALCLGIMLQEQLCRYITFPFLFSSLLVLLVAGIVLHRLRLPDGRLRRFRTIILYCTLAAMGMVLHWQRDIRHRSSWFGHLANQATAFELELIAEPVTKAKSILLSCEVRSALVHNTWVNTTGELPVYRYHTANSPMPQLGQRMLVPGKIRAIHNSGNPHAFDYQKYAARRNLYYQAFLSADEISLLPYEMPSAGSFVQQARRALLQAISVNLSDSATRALTEATLLNERTILDEGLLQAYSITGIVHIIAISGMHVSLLFTLLLFLLGWIRNRRYNWLKYLIAVPVVWFYIALTGYPPSAVRAAVAFTLLAVGIAGHRQQNSLHSWAAAGFLLLVYNPSWLYELGVQLSFLAVLSIILFYQPIRRLCTPRFLLLQYAWDCIAVSIAAQLLVFPLILYYFHQFPLLGLAASIPAALYSFLLMVGSLLLLLLYGLGLPAVWLGYLLTRITDCFHAIIIWLAQCTPHTFRALYIDIYEFWTMMLLVLVLCAFFFKRRLLYLQAGIGAACLLMAGSVLRISMAARQDRFVVYNVSGARHIDVIAGREVLYITDGNRDSGKVLQYTLQPARLAFRSREVRQVNQSIWHIQGRTVLLLQPGKSRWLRSVEVFPVDYLILGSGSEVQAELCKQVFRPRQVIIDGSVPRWQAIRWRKDFLDAGIAVHWVLEDGAWMLSSSTPDALEQHKRISIL